MRLGRRRAARRRHGAAPAARRRRAGAVGPRPLEAVMLEDERSRCGPAAAAAVAAGCAAVAAGCAAVAAGCAAVAAGCVAVATRSSGARAGGRVRACTATHTATALATLNQPQRQRGWGGGLRRSCADSAPPQPMALAATARPRLRPGRGPHARVAGHAGSAAESPRTAALRGLLANQANADVLLASSTSACQQGIVLVVSALA